MVLPIRITTSETMDFDALSTRGQNRALRTSYEAMGGHWLAKMLPRHFIRGAGQRYGYKPRSPRYEKRKRAMAAADPSLVQEGGRVLLVFTGGLKERLLNGGGAVLRAFPTRASIRLSAPDGIPLRPRATNKPNIGDELRVVTSEEQADLAAVAEKKLAKSIKSEAVGKRTQTKG